MLTTDNNSAIKCSVELKKLVEKLSFGMKEKGHKRKDNSHYRMVEGAFELVKALDTVLNSIKDEKVINTIMESLESRFEGNEFYWDLLSLISKEVQN
jgi:hypothetical protein